MIALIFVCNTAGLILTLMGDDDTKHGIIVKGLYILFYIIFCSSNFIILLYTLIRFWQVLRPPVVSGAN